MNDFQEKVALLTGSASGLSLVAAFGREAPMAGDHAPAFSLLNRDHVQEISRELVRQGAVIENFFREQW